MSGARTWSDQDLEQLRAWRAEGRTIAWIAGQMGRTHSSVKNAAPRHSTNFVPRPKRRGPMPFSPEAYVEAVLIATSGAGFQVLDTAPKYRVAA